MLDITQPPPHPLVSASILSADFGRMAEECRDVLDRGADALHVDVMDGHFVSNLTMGRDMIRGLRRHFPQTWLDAHLMVERPGDYVDPFADAGANHLSFHLEVCSPVHAAGIDGHVLIDRIHQAGMTAGLVINPYTPAGPLADYLNEVDLVLVMTVVPGRSGQAFMPEVLDKVRWLRERRRQETRLEVDGGVNTTTAPEAAAAGADVFVISSSLFGADDRGAVIDALHRANQP